MEYKLAATPLPQQLRRFDAMSPGRRMYSMLLRTVYVDESLIIDDLEVGIGVGSVDLLGTASISVLGEGRLAVL